MSAFFKCPEDVCLKADAVNSADALTTLPVTQTQCQTDRQDSETHSLEVEVGWVDALGRKKGERERCYVEGVIAQVDLVSCAHRNANLILSLNSDSCTEQRERQSLLANTLCPVLQHEAPQTTVKPSLFTHLCVGLTDVVRVRGRLQHDGDLDSHK